LSSATLITQALTNGLVVGMLYLLMAIGFTLVFGVMRVVNFAHGQFYMLGGLGLYLCLTELHLPFVVSLALVFVAALMLGALAEHLILRPFRADALSGMIVTIGLALIVQNLALWAFGPSPLSLPAVAAGVYHIGFVVLARSRLYAVGFSLAVLAAFFGFLRYTRGGRAVRAVVQDIEIARLQGIRAEWVHAFGFGLGVGLAAVAGALMAPLFSVSPFVGDTPLLKAFIVVILGGLGSVPGAALASLLLGVVESLAGTFLSTNFADIFQFILVILVLVFRPSGLLGHGEA
jgi:branched-chain amino acid transport system permease protein